MGPWHTEAAGASPEEAMEMLQGPEHPPLDIKQPDQAIADFLCPLRLGELDIYLFIYLSLWESQAGLEFAVRCNPLLSRISHFHGVSFPVRRLINGYFYFSLSLFNFKNVCGHWTGQ